MVGGFKFDDEFSEGIGYSRPENGQYEYTQANRPAFGVLSDRHPQIGEEILQVDGYPLQHSHVESQPFLPFSVALDVVISNRRVDSRVPSCGDVVSQADLPRREISGIHV